MKKFEIERPDRGDKEIKIIENGNKDEDYDETLTISIDYDDVNHPKIKKKIIKLVRILNEHWDESQ